MMGDTRGTRGKEDLESGGEPDDTRSTRGEKDLESGGRIKIISGFNLNMPENCNIDDVAATQSPTMI